MQRNTLWHLVWMSQIRPSLCVMHMAPEREMRQQPRKEIWKPHQTQTQGSKRKTQGNTRVCSSRVVRSLSNFSSLKNQLSEKPARPDSQLTKTTLAQCVLFPRYNSFLSLSRHPPFFSHLQFTNSQRPNHRDNIFISSNFQEPRRAPKTAPTWPCVGNVQRLEESRNRSL